jgi:hypothetical protein
MPGDTPRGSGNILADRQTFAELESVSKNAHFQGIERVAQELEETRTDEFLTDARSEFV